ncbi:MAG: DUF4266 domain-containing protein, partial [Pseudomonadota bacterium]
MLKRNKLLWLLVPMILMAGCTPVKPWERGILAKPEMGWSPDPLQGTLQQHVYFSKEGSSGGGGVGGGGCGFPGKYWGWHHRSSSSTSYIYGIRCL